ncbi:MAG: FAD-dependent oxidoreductase, partial [Pseudomonadota bacterium]|nr:FAD-dependent oxidoreductase [Pseudomonadota bacterium]
MSSPAIVIVGAGVLGLSTAFSLTRRGHAVTVIDPGGANASSVAAGMVAPAMESVLDDVTPETAALFRAGRDLWPEFAKAAGVALARRPAEWRGGDVAGLAARFEALGFEARRTGDRLITDEDYQIDPGQALGAL